MLVDATLVAVMAAADEAAAGWHRPVLLNDVLDLLAPRPGAVIVDGTAGTAGHSLAIAPRLLPDGRLIALDRDQASLAVAASRLAEFSPLASTAHANYRDLPSVLQAAGVSRIDGLLLDLGMSSPQVDQPERGFSFLREGPLDMRMDLTQALTAREIVNTWSADELSALFHTLGEERFARRIAARIARERRDAPIDTTTQLAELIAKAVPPGARHGRLHPATRVFQALRMAVNDELGALRDALDAAAGLLAPGGRLVIITFHSLEDRMVKHAFLDGQRAGRWRVLTKKPVRPGEEEVRENARARSAKLRAVERLP